MAEDDPLMSRMYERAFKISGYDLETASNGNEAVTKIQAMDPKPALILLDVMMMNMSGFDVIQILKKDEKLKDIPVIFLSNLTGQEDADKGLQLGAVAYLVKSQYSPKQVVEKVQEVLSVIQGKVSLAVS